MRSPATDGVFNIASAMLDAHIAAGRGASTALWTEDGQRLSYQELDAYSSQVGNLLRSLGTTPEQRIVIALHDGPEFVATFLGALKIGAVPVPVNTQASDTDLAHFLSWPRARALVADAAIADRARALIADDEPVVIVAVGAGAGTSHVDFA